MLGSLEHPDSQAGGQGEAPEGPGKGLGGGLAGGGRCCAACPWWEASGGHGSGPHPTLCPVPTDSLRDLSRTLPPDAVDPDQAGVAGLQEVEQGGLERGVPRAAHGQREAVPGLEHVLDALPDVLHDLGESGMQVRPRPLPSRSQVAAPGTVRRP